MPRLPQPGSDEGAWGDILNQYLLASHAADGTLKSDAVTTTNIQDDSIAEVKLDSAVRAKLNSGSPSTLDDLTDVNTTGAVDDQALTYQGGTWQPGTITSGESNTASNVGVGGVGFFKQKTGVNLEFKNLRAASNKLTVTNDAPDNEVEIDVVTANLGLTSADVGLGNVDNTSDANKPVSTATQTALDAKADETITVTGATSLTGGGDLTTNRTISLLNDAASPGNSRYYGTDGTGTKGFHTIPTQDPTVGGDLTGTASNAQIATGAIVNADINASAAIAQSKIANLTTDLAAKLDDKNETVTLTDSTNDKFLRVNINDDASPTGSWPDRLAFYFDSTRTGYFNEYGELRARPGKDNTVALRALGWNGASTAYVFEVTNNNQSSTYFGVKSTVIDAAVPIVSTSTISATGTVTGSNIGNKVTTSGTAPSSPSVGDVWVDTST